jgi:hypothetical protein
MTMEKQNIVLFVITLDIAIIFGISAFKVYHFQIIWASIAIQSKFCHRESLHSVAMVNDTLETAFQVQRPQFFTNRTFLFLNQ